MMVKAGYTYLATAFEDLGGGDPARAIDDFFLRNDKVHLYGTVYVCVTQTFTVCFFLQLFYLFCTSSDSVQS